METQISKNISGVDLRIIKTRNLFEGDYVYLNGFAYKLQAKRKLSSEYPPTFVLYVCFFFNVCKGTDLVRRFSQNSELLLIPGATMRSGELIRVSGDQIVSMGERKIIYYFNVNIKEDDLELLENMLMVKKFVQVFIFKIYARVIFVQLIYEGNVLLSEFATD